jgi:hypothetical protein
LGETILQNSGTRREIAKLRAILTTVITREGG